jgi:thiol-disulfide isomerase/thioredoxin
MRRLLPLGLIAVPLLALADDPAPAAGEVTLQRLSFDTLMGRIQGGSGKAKLTLVDAWATYCPPCKENFPHVLEMSRKYGPKGLRVISASFDDPEDRDAVKAAEQFLREQKSTIENVLVAEENGGAYEKFNINAIPAVFLYGPDGREIKRFTLDDPDNQFTYAQVEREVERLLGAESAQGAR